MRQIPDVLRKAEAFQYRPARRIQTVAAHFFTRKFFPLKNERAQPGQRTKCRTARSSRSGAHDCNVETFHSPDHQQSVNGDRCSAGPLTDHGSLVTCIPPLSISTYSALAHDAIAKQINFNGLVSPNLPCRRHSIADSHYVFAANRLASVRLLCPRRLHRGGQPRHIYFTPFSLRGA